MKAVLSIIAILSTLGCIAGSSLCAEPARTPEHRISNGVLSLGICNRDAGAVCSIIYGGHEFVNDYDHGRQMQVAWFVNGDLTGAINPTEAGSHDDGRGPTSTSELLSVKVAGNTLTTENHPAYWFRPGRGLNTQAVTNDTLKKTITLGYNGDTHVIVFNSSVTLSPVLTGPPVKRIRIEVPAFYTSSALTEHYELNLNSGAMVKLIPSPKGEIKGRMNPRMGINTNRRLIPVLSSRDGRYAVAEYTPLAENFWTYSSYSIPSDDPANACNKVTTRFDQAAEVGRTYSYRTFIIIGDLETVKNSVMKLP